MTLSHDPFPQISRDDLKQLHSLTKHLSKPNMSIYWIDLIITALIAWGAFCVAIQSDAFSLTQGLATLTAACAFYKGVNFVHEISHNPQDMKSLALAYNVAFGFYTRVLSYFGDSHPDHHSSRKFGTRLDPEYENWSYRHPANILRPAVASFISPLLMFVRIAILPLFYFFAGEKFQIYVNKKFSSIVMNFAYEYSDTNETRLKNVKRLDTAAMVLIWSAIAFCLTTQNSAQILVIHYLTLVLSNMLGSFRALGVHRYTSQFQQRPAQDQFFDSVSIQDTLFSGLWAPLNSNYHSIHHLLPHIPYHSMREAHQILMNEPRWQSFYALTLEKTLFASLGQLFRRAHANAAPAHKSCSKTKESA